MSLEFYWDEDGTPRARAGSALALLAGFLESEVQGSFEVGGRFLDRLVHVRAGRLEAWAETGNAYTVSIRPDEVEIMLEEGRKGRMRVAPEQFEKALQDWLGFLQTHP